jgi:gamma-glutamylcyclotransferase (GGCT)/AIG2-like uncharacterized protein YtfP
VSSKSKAVRRLVARAPAPLARSLVFSFGSNLHEPQLRERCPDAMQVGPAVLRGFRLAFVGHSPRWGGAVATVRPSVKAEVLGELVLLTDADLTRLDGFEGAPTVYKRTRVQVHTHTASGARREVSAWTYVRDGGEADPSLTYVSRIACGYGRLGYDDAPIVQAIKTAERAQARRWEAFNAAVEPAPPVAQVGGARRKRERMSDYMDELFPNDDRRSNPDEHDADVLADLSDVPPSWYRGRAS